MAKSVKRLTVDPQQNKNITEIAEIRLPDSIILEIFRYLPFRDLCIASRVCKQWNRITKDDSLRKIIDARQESLCIKDVWKLLRYHCSPVIRDLRLKGYVMLLKLGKPKWKTLTVTQAFLKQLEKQCPLLQTICLEEVFLANDANTELTVMNLPQNLKCLGLRNSFFHPDRFFGTKPSTSLPLLEHLDLGNCTLISSYDLNAFNDFHHLKELYLEGCFRVNNGGIDHIRSLVQHLKVLDIESTDVSENGVLTIMNEGVMLKELYIGFVRFSDRIFTPELKCSSIETLCLRFTSVSDSCIGHFAYIFPHLKELFIKGSQISEHGVRSLFSMLPNCKADYNTELTNTSKCNHSFSHWLSHQKY